MNKGESPKSHASKPLHPSPMRCTSPHFPFRFPQVPFALVHRSFVMTAPKTQSTELSRISVTRSPSFCTVPLNMTRRFYKKTCLRGRLLSGTSFLVPETVQIPSRLQFYKMSSNRSQQSSMYLRCFLEAHSGALYCRDSYGHPQEGTPII